MKSRQILAISGTALSYLIALGAFSVSLCSEASDLLCPHALNQDRASVSTSGLELPIKTHNEIAPKSKTPFEIEVFQSPNMDLAAFGLEASSAVQISRNDDGRLAAVVLRESHEDPRFQSDRAELQILDLVNHKILFRQNFASLEKIFFVPGTETLVVNGRTNSDDRKRKLFLFQLSSSHLRIESQIQEPGQNLPVAKSSQAQPLKSIELELEGSKGFGVDVAQVIGSQTLPSVFVVQNSANTRKDILYQGSLGPTTTSVLNQSTFLLSVKNGKAVEELKFGDYVPVDLNLNPHSNLMAMRLEDPVVARKKVKKVVLVDATDPQKILWSYEFANSSFEIHLEMHTVGKQELRLKTEWNAEGTKLAIYDKALGSLVIHDLLINQTFEILQTPESRWPLAGIKFLQDGSLLILRWGHEPTGLDSKIRSGIFAQVLMPSGGSSALFEIKFHESRLRRLKTEISQPELLAIHELKQGRVWAFGFDDQIVLMGAQSPSQQKILIEPQEGTWRPVLKDIKKVSETRLEITDLRHGVYDWIVP
jgi:hypothetical protein